MLRLRKALYGLRQVPKGMGFEQSPHEAAIYRWGNGGNALLVGVYVYCRCHITYGFVQPGLLFTYYPCHISVS